jgi:polyisoprenoid-binding protein YceI
VVVRDRVQVTVASEEDAARRGPDPLALLASDVAAARDDVRAIGDGVAGQFQTLHGALESAATGRARAAEEAVAALRTEVAAPRARIDTDARAAASARVETHSALIRLADGLDAVSAALAHGTGVAPAEIAHVEIAPAAAVEVVVEEPPPAPAEPDLVVAPAKSATKGFLSFQIPSQGFAFDRLQRYSVLPNLSRVGFDAKSTLHDFSGVTTSVEGEITANLAHPSQRCGGSVRARTASLDTGLDARDESMQAILEPAKHSEIRFEWTAFEGASIDAAAQKVTGTAKGRLTLHGTTKDLAIPVTVAVDASKRLVIDGQARIRMSDFGVRPPSKLGLVSVEDEAVLWIALRARTLGPAEEAAR